MAAVAKQQTLLDPKLEETPERTRIIQEYLECEEACQLHKDKMKIAAQLKKARKDAKDKILEFVEVPSEGATYNYGNMVSITVTPGGEKIDTSHVSKPRITIKKAELPV